MLMQPMEKLSLFLPFTELSTQHLNQKVEVLIIFF